MILNTKQFWNWWTTELRSWMTERFNSVISHLPQDLSNLAKESTLNQQSAEIKTAISKGGGNPCKMAYEAMKRLQPYLYAIEYSELDYEAARAYFSTHFVPVQGACTALRKGNQLGRNYDWTYDKQVEFLVRTKAHNGRYASIGIAGSISALTTDTIGEYSEEFKYMPFRMLDGMNEKGLTANVNMLNHAEGRSLPVDGTTPRIEEREAICSAMLVRYVLDNFTTPKEACEYIRDYVRVYPPYHDGKTTDLHFSLTNKEQLYYLCFEPDNGGVFRTAIADVKDQPLPFVMTNFRMWWAQRIYDSETGKYDRFADPNYQYVEKYGMGIERANLCLQFVQDTETTQSVLDFMNIDLRYTEAYAPLGDWLTEFVGPYSQEDLARDSAPEEFERILGIVRQRYAERSRETALTWQTVHSVVYNLDTMTMQLVIQQGYDALEFSFVKSLPATKEDVQNVDLSNVAQQGNNPAATNSAIYERINATDMRIATDEEVQAVLDARLVDDSNNQ
ncbi:MAG: linear amide C-N hydrolase [Paludibacteraceae bacterium]|nr:linear amide C-N hydrolase [Paludibacteraceae bacterium]